MFRFVLFSVIISFGFQASFAQDTSGDYVKEINKYRKDYKKALLADEGSPLNEKKQVKSMSFYEADNAYIVKCLFIRTAEEKPFDMPTFSGESKPYLKYGELLFELPGMGTHRISVYQSLRALTIAKYKNHLFIPFKDLTNGESTYDGGRYIDLKVNDIKKGIVYLDFNKAYNPWCAYSEGFICPVPPLENQLNIKIEAGEKSFDYLAIK